MRYRIAIDTGGTFTDVVVADTYGSLTVAKAPTNNANIYQGISTALSRAASDRGMTTERLLESSDLVNYTTTHPVNAVIQRKVAKTAFLVTEGFPDILTLRGGGKLGTFDLHLDYPEPYIPRGLTYEIPERIDASGRVVRALDQDEARRTIRQLSAEAIGVCFLWSVVNPSHELIVGEIIEEELGDIPYSLSHRVNPVVREYPRASTTAIDASLKPEMVAHLVNVESGLRHSGFGGELLLGTSYGGVGHMNDLIERPVYTLGAGPALAPVAGRAYSRAEAGQTTADIIVCDAGGTSFDVSLVRGGSILTTRENWIGDRFTGHLFGVSSVKTHSIGAGGGSIAWVDDGGLLRVGPQSAGASPGPACYGKGGTLATVTDAAVVLGYLDPTYFLGGRMALDVESARAVVADLGSSLGEPLEKTAWAVLTIANQHMIRAIQSITVAEGVDPRDCLLVAGGGAAGLNILSIARELGCQNVLVPRTAAALTACGGQFTDLIAEFSTSHFTTSEYFDADAINDTLSGLTRTLSEFTSELEARLEISDIENEFVVDARYRHQVWELQIPMTVERFESKRDVLTLVDEFSRLHNRVFGFEQPDAVEFVNWKARRIAKLGQPPASHQRRPRTQASNASTCEHRSAYFGSEGYEPVAVLRGTTLDRGSRIAGPAIIQEPTTTLVVYPNYVVDVTEHGNYVARPTSVDEATEQ